MTSAPVLARNPGSSEPGSSEPESSEPGSSEPTTTNPVASDPIAEASVPNGTARVRFRQPVSRSGFIDMAWWPRTRDLATELPALMDVLWTANREITRVTYNLQAWDAAPRRLQIAGRTVKLGGFATSDPLTVRLSDPWGQDRIDVLVIAPDTDAATAERAMQIAGQADNGTRAAEILEQAHGTASVMSTP